MKHSETSFLDTPTPCDCCGDVYPYGHLINDNGDDICEECLDIIEIANNEE